MFSCNHFLWDRKQSVMSKRAQESNSKEGSAVAKPRPMSWCQGTSWAPRKPLRKTPVHPKNREIKSWIRVMFVERPESGAILQPRPNTLSRKLVKSGESASSASTKKLVWDDDIKSKGQGWKCHYMQISDHRYIEKDVKNLQKIDSRRKDTSTWYRSLEEPTCWSGDCFCRQRWKPQFILD